MGANHRFSSPALLLALGAKVDLAVGHSLLECVFLVRAEQIVKLVGGVLLFRDPVRDANYLVA